MNYYARTHKPGVCTSCFILDNDDQLFFVERGEKGEATRNAGDDIDYNDDNDNNNPFGRLLAETSGQGLDPIDYFQILRRGREKKRKKRKRIRLRNEEAKRKKSGRQKIISSGSFTRRREEEISSNDRSERKRRKYSKQVGFCKWHIGFPHAQD